MSGSLEEYEDEFGIGADLRRQIDATKSRVGSPIVDYSTYKPTENELNNITYLSMKTVGWGMRDVDFMIALQMCGKIETVDDLDSAFIPALVDYIWDHILGEPDDPTLEDISYVVGGIRDVVYTMDEETRNSL